MLCLRGEGRVRNVLLRILRRGTEKNNDPLLELFVSCVSSHSPSCLVRLFSRRLKPRPRPPDNSVCNARSNRDPDPELAAPASPSTQRQHAATPLAPPDGGRRECVLNPGTGLPHRSTQRHPPAFPLKR